MAKHRFHKLPRRRSLVTLLAVTTGALFGAVALGVSQAQHASADVLTNASADASVSAAAPTTVQNTGWLSMDASPTQYGYFKFDVTVPAGQTVTKALFECWAGSSSSAGAELWKTSSAWSETTLTWADAPKPDFAQPPVGRTGAVTAGSYTQANVTGAVTGSGPVTLVTRTSSTTRWSCASKENTSNHPAKLIVTTAPTSGSPVPSQPSSSSSSSAPAPSTGHKLLTIVEENHSQSEALKSMPYLASLASQYGHASAFHAVTHPSLPNYLAVAGGNTFGVSDDNAPSSHPIAGDSVFDQTVRAGKSARTYAESMTSNCQLSSSGNYAVKHNPWAYFNGSTQRSNCKAGDVPMGTTASGNLLKDINSGSLPNSGMMVPNLCNDAHNCSLGTADTWLKSWLPKLMAGPDYTSGKLTIVVTFDEDDSSAGNNVAFVVVDPRLNNAHKVVTTNGTHYSLTRWYDQNVGAALLRNAATAADLKSAFGL
ncbi:MAG TPA: alkaline phosphatase family protein [Jatrophihabitans sp.]|nr:alkaline phosphatase family protein [Jatrophihabitans sp.]